MRAALTRLSITRQFTLLAVFGVALTLFGLALSLKRGYDLAFEAKRTEIQHIVEVAASTIQTFADQAKQGQFSEAEAQRRALDAIRAVRYNNGTNYIFVYTFDGIALVLPGKGVVGTNRINLTDSNGKKYVQAFVDTAKSGTPGFVDYRYPKLNETEPKPKISYIAGLPGLAMGDRQRLVRR